MNRKTFLSSLLALITAPFLVKSKENGIPLKGEPVTGLIDVSQRDSDGYAKYLVPDNEKLIVYVDGKPINCLRSTYLEDYQEPPVTVKLSGKAKITGEDLMVLNRKR